MLYCMVCVDLDTVQSLTKTLVQFKVDEVCLWMGW